MIYLRARKAGQLVVVATTGGNNTTYTLLCLCMHNDIILTVDEKHARIT